MNPPDPNTEKAKQRKKKRLELWMGMYMLSGFLLCVYSLAIDPYQSWHWTVIPIVFLLFCAISSTAEKLSRP